LNASADVKSIQQELGDQRKSKRNSNVEPNVPNVPPESERFSPVMGNEYVELVSDELKQRDTHEKKYWRDKITESSATAAAGESDTALSSSAAAAAAAAAAGGGVSTADKTPAAAAAAAAGGEDNAEIESAAGAAGGEDSAADSTPAAAAAGGGEDSTVDKTPAAAAAAEKVTGTTAHSEGGAEDRPVFAFGHQQDAAGIQSMFDGNSTRGASSSAGAAASPRLNHSASVLDPSGEPLDLSADRTIITAKDKAAAAEITAAEQHDSSTKPAAAEQPSTAGAAGASVQAPTSTGRQVKVHKNAIFFLFF
jgi:hypothetical protein